jgi:sugar/nucleoside kinase (ribokinase family)
LFVWEPVPGNCTPNEWKDCIEAMQRVDVITPNVNEAAEFLGKTINEEEPFSQFKPHVESIAAEYGSHLSPGKAVVIRCGRYGCLLRTGEEEKWFPAYHQSGEKVVDPTGGGNAFCGGFCAGWVQSHGDFEMACVSGNIAASYVIEQFGLPALSSVDGERWNGESVQCRRETYEALCEGGIHTPQ